jgi:hypothetical protein
MIAEVEARLIGVLRQGGVEDAFEVDHFRSGRHGNSSDMPDALSRTWKATGMATGIAQVVCTRRQKLRLRLVGRPQPTFSKQPNGALSCDCGKKVGTRVLLPNQETTCKYPNHCKDGTCVTLRNERRKPVSPISEHGPASASCVIFFLCALIRTT